MISFMYPLLSLLIFLPFLARYILPKASGLHGDALRIPFILDIKEIKQHESKYLSSLKTIKNPLSFLMLFSVWCLLTLAAMRPVLLGEPYRPKNFGHEIILTLDISTSMLEDDYAYSGRRISRINAVKAAVYDFLDKRKEDKIGLVLFGTRAYLQAPPTFDKESLKEIVLGMEPGMAGQSTSIGDALGLSVKALDNGNNDIPRIVILLTDGENNDGSISVAKALTLAQEAGVKIYTIGVGNDRSLFQSIISSMTSFKTEDSSGDLQALAKATNGQYFKAADTASLFKVYDIIDKLEAQETDEKYVQNTTDLYYIPLLAAIVLSILVLLLKRIKND